MVLYHLDNKTTTMKNIHVLPTEKPSRLHLAFNKLYYLSVKPFIHLDIENYKSFHIYITSDEKFTSSKDWFIDIKDNRNHLHQVGYSLDSYEWTEQYNPQYFKKIILTTDQDLIAEGVQNIDDEFLEWFVKNPSCEKVEVKQEKIVLGEVDGTTYIDFNYKIIIPKEEHKQDYCEKCDCLICECWDEPKQETLEEAVNAFKKTNVYTNEIKQKQERSYSEEEVFSLLTDLVNSDFIDFTKEYGIRGWDELNKWFEQNKKK
jgi:hypothetical protein